MFMFQKMKHAAKDESGAVTVDWIMLTAAMMGAAVAFTTTFDEGLQGVAAELNSVLDLKTGGDGGED